MTKKERLKKEAREAATWRGHKLGRFNGGTLPSAASAECMTCGQWVIIDTQPLPNGMEIGGPAIALNCSATI